MDKSEVTDQNVFYFCLVALASVVSAVGKSASSSLSSIGSGGSSSGGGTPAVSNYGQKASQQTIKVIAEFKLRGRDLVAVARSQEYRSEIVK